MRLNFLAAVIGTALILAPAGLAQQQDKTQSPQARHQVSGNGGMQQAIAFERAKDRDDARQARLERLHPSVSYSDADRQMDESTSANRVKDKGATQGMPVKK